MNAYNNIFPLDAVKSTIIQDNINKILNEKSRVLLNLANIPRREVTTTSQVTAQQLLRLPKHVEIRHYDNGEIHIFPLVDQEIELNQIKLMTSHWSGGKSCFELNKFEPYISNGCNRVS